MRITLILNETNIWYFNILFTKTNKIHKFTHIALRVRAKTAKDSLHNIIQLVANILVLRIIVYPWVASHKGVLASDVERVVDLPVDVAYFACWVEQALQQTW